MKAYQIKRIIGYGLWALGFLVFLPPALLEPEGPVSLYQFFMFNALVVCLFGGFLVVDSANTALERLAHRQQVDQSAFLGTVETLQHRDKHFHPPAPVAEAFEDHQPDDMPAARSLIIVVVGLLVVCALLALVMRSAATNESLMPNASKEQPGQVPV